MRHVIGLRKLKWFNFGKKKGIDFSKIIFFDKHVYTETKLLSTEENAYGRLQEHHLNV